MADRGFEWFGEEYLRRVSADIARQMREIGVVGVQYAQYMAPVRTGELRQGISYEYDESTHTLSLISRSGHSLFVEFGTYKMAARPYLRPALQQMAQILTGRGIGSGANLGMDFQGVTPIRNPEILAHPRNARHRAIMARNRNTSIDFNRGAAGQARQHIRHRNANP